jgi:uncharacterized NAD(P)/FAD-binding protein YdhS
LNTVEQQRFLRHYQPYWDAHRHRMAPATAEAFAKLIRDGVVQPIAGRLQSACPNATSTIVEMKLRGACKRLTLTVDRIINCTGPTTNLIAVKDPLLQTMLGQGLVTPDSHRLGLLVDDNFSVLDQAGIAAERLSYIGPMLKAQHWEATAVPELRAFAYHLSRSLVERYTPEGSLLE